MRLSWNVVDNSTGGPVAIGSRYCLEADGATTEGELRRLYGEAAEMLAAAMLDALVMCAANGRPPYHPAVRVELDCDQFQGGRLHDRA